MTNWLALREQGIVPSQLDYFLIDGSGSMAGKWHQTNAALYNFMTTMRDMNAHSHGIAVVFDERNLGDIQIDDTLANWPHLGQTNLGLPGGMTPLFDAVNLMGRHLRELNPARARVVIVTDGDENASRHTDGFQARAILDWIRAMGWTVTFLGADFNNDRQAKLLGADKHNTIGVRKELLPEAGKLLANKSARNHHTGDEINFSDEERTTFGGYLAGPSGN